MDECLLDVSGSVSLFGSGLTIPPEISGRIKEGGTVSVGILRNKIFAKLGSIGIRYTIRDRGEETFPVPGAVSAVC